VDILGEALVAVRLEQGRVRHGDHGPVDPLTNVAHALDARCGPHPVRQCLLRGTPDHRAVGERIGEGKADLDDVGAASHGRLGQRGRLPPGHEIHDERLPAR
jgi:hypothetical protein